VRALARAITRTQPGTVVRLLVWHNEEPTVIIATVQELPQATPPAPELPPPATGPTEPGWDLARIDDAARHTFGLDRDLTGVVITRIAPGGPAADAGLNSGDVVFEVQQERVAAPDDVARVVALARQQQRHYAAMLVHNADGLRWLALSLD
jgi:serine protease Do